MVYEAELLFRIKLPWQQTTFQQLKLLAVSYKWDNEGVWVFSIDDLKDIEKIIGKEIKIPGYKEQGNKQELIVPNFKGKDSIELIENPTTYIIIEHRKIEKADDTTEIKELKHEVSRALVDIIWNNIIFKQPLNKPIKTSTVSENICRLLCLDRFFRDDTLSFDFPKFFGNRKDYYTYFYLPMKVLSYQKKIKHHKSGMVERLI
jgi:hypothetical protein